MVSFFGCCLCGGIRVYDDIVRVLFYDDPHAVGDSERLPPSSTSA